MKNADIKVLALVAAGYFAHKKGLDKKAAAAFVAYVTGPQGQAILAKYGFKKP